MNSPHRVLPPLTLVIGGARSGKSHYAEQLALSHRDQYDQEPPLVYVAAYPRPSSVDLEMESRISRHQQDRSTRFTTLENHHDLKAIAQNHPQSTLVLDCLTLWLFVMSERGLSTPDILQKLHGSLDEGRSLTTWIIVANELGQGIVPADPQTRAFRDLAGWANQKVAALADQVILMVAGIPLVVKKNTII